MLVIRNNISVGIYASLDSSALCAVRQGFRVRICLIVLVDAVVKAFDQIQIFTAPVSMIRREKILTPRISGICALDSLVPMGRGQRQLVVGDRQSGKATLALDFMMFQVFDGVDYTQVGIGRSAVVVALVWNTIGVRAATVVSTVSALIKAAPSVGSKFCVVAGTPERETMSLYYTPYAATSVCDIFQQAGIECAIAFNDLSKHANFYRQLSLILSRSPGREAFPGDIFFVHALLLERSSRTNRSLGSGASVTAFPIVETLEGMVSAYIPTNVISITDGQVSTEIDFAKRSVLPAIDLGSSVTRIGSKAQLSSLAYISGLLKGPLAQYRDLLPRRAFREQMDEVSNRLFDVGDAIVTHFIQPALGFSTPAVSVGGTMKVFSESFGYVDADAPVAEILRRRREIGVYRADSQRAAGLTAVRGFIGLHRLYDDSLIYTEILLNPELYPAVGLFVAGVDFSFASTARERIVDGLIAVAVAVVYCVVVPAVVVAILLYGREVVVFVVDFYLAGLFSAQTVVHDVVVTIADYYLVAIIKLGMLGEAIMVAVIDIYYAVLISVEVLFYDVVVFVVDYYLVVVIKLGLLSEVIKVAIIDIYYAVLISVEVFFYGVMVFVVDYYLVAVMKLEMLGEAIKGVATILLDGADDLSYQTGYVACFFIYSVVDYTLQILALFVDVVFVFCMFSVFLIIVRWVIRNTG